MHPLNPLDGARNVRALLFDLGGVLIDIDFGRVLQRWAALSALPVADLKAAFGFDAAYERHERGEIDGAGYFQILRTRLRLNATDDEIAAGWNAVFAGEMADAMAAVRKAREHLPCYAFTNTNRVHFAACLRRFPWIESAFDGVFTSYALGARKPERAAFDAVSRAIGVEPGSIVFFDDTPENVAGAQAAGLRAVLVTHPGGLPAAMSGAGLDARA